MFRNITILIVSLLFASPVLLSQNFKTIKKKGDYYKLIEASSKQGQWAEYQFNSAFTSIAIEISDQCSFTGALIVTGQDTMPISRVDDIILSSAILSDLIIPSGETCKFSLYLPCSTEEIRLHLMYAEALPAQMKRLRDKTNTSACSQPTSIDQSIWRDGLTDIAGNPSSTEVLNIIIHHSAGSNSNTDYYEVVRNIYLYHREVKSWDDVGYNYLIAQDGTIFDGRDGMGIIDDDNVRGAHYCAKNTSTMGICVLGNYMDILPSDSAMSSLKRLLAWKLNKEDLQPMGSSRHPVSDPAAEYLPTIAGHRLGCSTDCPGDELNTLLPQIRLDVQEYMVDNCGLVPDTSNSTNPGAGIDEESIYNISLSPNPFEESFILKTEKPITGIIEIYNNRGRLVYVESLEEIVEMAVEAGFLNAGVYFISIITDTGKFTYRLVKL